MYFLILKLISNFFAVGGALGGGGWGLRQKSRITIFKSCRTIHLFCSAIGLLSNGERWTGIRVERESWLCNSILISHVQSYVNSYHNYRKATEIWTSSFIAYNRVDRGREGIETTPPPPRLEIHWISWDCCHEIGRNIIRSVLVDRNLKNLFLFSISDGNIVDKYQYISIFLNIDADAYRYKKKILININIQGTKFWANHLGWAGTWWH